MRIRLALCAGVILGSAAVTTVAEEPRYKNLKVLPPDISRERLGDVMLDNLRGLGLPRLAGEGCLYCHVGDLETPRGEWDYASDAKPMKAKARVMMAMTGAINADYLAKLESRADATFRVTCTTCHAGRTDPRPLPDLLWSVYEEGGIEAASSKYRELRDRYYGGDAYDFRLHVLPGIATRMADSGAIDDAISLARLNVDHAPEEPSAKRGWVALRLERTIDAHGVEAALAELSAMESSLTKDVLTPGLLDSLAWRLNRSERAAAGHALIEANFRRFPERYRALESMAFILADTDRKEEAFALLEGWLEKNPDHARARRLLINLRDE